MTHDLAHIGIPVTLNRVKEYTDNLTGDSEKYFGDDVTVQVTFYHENEDKRLVESGLARQGFIVIYAKPEDNIKRNDMITIQGEKYLIENDPLIKGFPNVMMFHQFNAQKYTEQ